MRRGTTTDLRSIFVGNLPANIIEEQLFHMFDIYGAIQHIEIVRKPSANRKLGTLVDLWWFLLMLASHWYQCLCFHRIHDP